MKPIKSLLVLAAILVTPAVASAQGYGGGGGYYAQPPATQLPGGFHNRQGRIIWGFTIGLGDMSDRFGDVNCGDCDYSPLAGMVSGRLGGFLGPRFALMAELQGNAQTLSSNRYSGTTTLGQGALMVAAQYWLMPQLWVKGGLGFASLQVNQSYYSDGVIDASSIPENGVAIMGALGYELLSARHFSIDLEGRVINGSYDAIDNHLTSATIGLGINWF